ncbi:ArsR/SmtB family transcription factor [Cohaesibacter celericrescens]|uniref:Transcriptional regulator n=1 Tax=Cohaesibacter celericrescens TaxID=2067669 RepID=A0A2N5XQR8_9HYPH|nr:transcriptional regulator [Cohaesibacter celericrescens]
MKNLTNTFGALSDPIRLRILALIAHETELCVCELVEALELSQPKISRHCQSLNEANLIKSRRQAQWVLYSLATDIPDWTKRAMDSAIEGVKLDAQYVTDCDRLKSVDRPPVRCAPKEKEAC